MKTEAKAVVGHTAGPWQKIRRHDGRPCVVKLDENDNLEHVVAGPSTTLHNEQDLQLISAAPELLEALRPLARLQVESCFKCDQTGREGNEICPVCGGLGALVLGKPSPEEIMDARQVIAKAELDRPWSFHGVTTTCGQAILWHDQLNQGFCPWCGKDLGRGRYSNHNRHLRGCKYKPKAITTN